MRVQRLPHSPWNIPVAAAAVAATAGCNEVVVCARTLRAERCAQCKPHHIRPGLHSLLHSAGEGPDHLEWAAWCCLASSPPRFDSDSDPASLVHSIEWALWPGNTISTKTQRSRFGPTKGLTDIQTLE
ncbi:hypothetical protein PoB_004558000 [Plakobranchus ocellatus]|uniref:Secreted protein n=1 Tax=Plakobranchus ocellatus TaxID=259542 RepID=A0AAV4BEQ8_9GAST|nr:hypothetical protein PoB_004558000 [Plakobranchus ocellatus]